MVNLFAKKKIHISNFLKKLYKSNSFKYQTYYKFTKKIKISIIWTSIILLFYPPKMCFNIIKLFYLKNSYFDYNLLTSYRILLNKII